MGSSSSHISLNESIDTQNQPLYLTPPRRVLYVDPRSPSAGIDRTPILVEKTPTADLGLDPRSPTIGIVRTPISTNSVKSKLVPKADCLSSDLTSHGGDNLGLDIEEMQVGVGTDTLDPLGLSTLSLLEESQEESCHMISDDQGENQEDSCQLIPDDQDKPVNSTGQTGSGLPLPISKPLPKPLFSKRDKWQGNKVTSSDTRSPLRARNQHSNSPRIIMQRKLITSLDNQMSYHCAHKEDNTPPSRDKENVTSMRM